jgi:hypothetical protein
MIIRKHYDVPGVYTRFSSINSKPKRPEKNNKPLLKTNTVLYNYGGTTKVWTIGMKIPAILV